MGKAIGGHHTRRRGSTTDDWITPRHVIDALGPFDLDPCASMSQPWPCAARQYTARENGLLQPWQGRVWLNPPYGRRTIEWIRRLADHGNGIALIFARTETELFFEHVWGRASGLLFLCGRLTFYRPDGSKAEHNSGGPSVLIAYGDGAAERLRKSSLGGAFVRQDSDSQA